ncbi:cell adhesion molecule Dscam2-like isoform X2 [Daphnia carinata]|uniref:cell adhesion molecule Dscam2-like isoform X2 n=1 Tax=Daphnia carinata TaxID=120202 RepID=UPI00286951BE|nr:cell adhesion molecule Dscam2-like isoform X2 [Daphnia carinata]
MASPVFIPYQVDTAALIFTCCMLITGLHANSSSSSSNVIASSNQHAGSGMMDTFASGTAAAGPRFQNQLPSDVTFTPDRGFTIECPVWGQPTPQITWLTSKGNNAAGMWNPVESSPTSATTNNLITISPNGSLTLHTFRPEQFRPDVHAANYRCLAANFIGRILSTPVRVRAVILPPFEVNVENPRVRRGSTAVFRCSVPDSVRDYVTVTSWIQDNRYDIFLTSSQDGRHVMLANGDLHVLSARQGDENHLYHCRVLVQPNGQTMTSSTAGRIILSQETMTKMAPVIVESANRIRVWRGQDAVLPCVFHGYPPPKIKWYKSQTIQYGNLLLPLVASAATQEHRGGVLGLGRHRLVGGTLLIASVVAEDQGRYICSVNNSMGLVESRTELVFRDKLQVRIVESSNVVASSAAQHIQVADAETSVTITCQFSGSPRPVVSWLKDGQRYLVGNNGRVSSSSSGDDGNTDMVQLSISSVQREDEGIYQCLASNDEGDWAQASVQLTIGAFPPHLKETFSRQVLHPGSSVSLKCLASGTPLPHFTWTLDGFPLSPVSERYFLGQQQQTGHGDLVVAHLNITHVRVEDGGNYKCIAENRVGRVEHSANLHIYGAPYVRRMSTVVGVGGKRLELPCPVAGYPIEAITWEKDGRRLPLNGRQRLQFNGSLTIDPVDKSSDAGLYSCEARAQNGLSARQSLQLNILDAPHIMAMSDSAVLNAGERLALQCAVVKGGLPLSVSWSKDGQVIAPTTATTGPAATTTTSVRLVNEFTATLTIESLTGQHGGWYVCRAANEGGRAESAVHVVVQAGPRITPFGMPSRNVMVNSRVQVSCVIEEGDPPFHIRWYRDDKPLVHHHHHLSSSASSAHRPANPVASLSSTDPPIRHGPLGAIANGLRLTDFNSYSSILTIDQVTVNHGGNYSCRAENAAGTAVHSTLLHVSVPPFWVNQQPPADTVQTVSGHSVELKCHVHGVPTPQVIWSFTRDKTADKYTTLFANTNRTLLANQSLVISPVDVSDAGYYQCEASNGVGNNINALMALQVHAPPEVHLNQDYMAVRRGSLTGTVLKCSIRGDPPLNVHWRKDSVPLDPTQSRVATRAQPATGSHPSSPLHPTLLTSELSVTNAAVADEGLYECAASNMYGEDSDAVFLQVQDVPQPPLDVRVASAAGRRIQLEWKPPATDGGNPLQEFIIFYQSPGGDVRQERIMANQFSGSIGNLQPATVYQIYMTASNALGQSQPSLGLTVTTDEEAPEGPPLQVGASSVTSRGFTLSWAPPAPPLQHGIIQSYLVTIDSGRMLNRTVLPSGSNEYTIAGLRPNTNYHAYVQAVNNQGTGPASPSVSVKTSEAPPEEPPLNVACVSLNSQSLQITWQPPRPDYRNGLLRGYRIFYEPLSEFFYSSSPDQSDLQTSSSQTTTELTVFLSGLQKFSNYSIQVLAFTGAGDGVKSQPLTCTTEEDIPEMPTRLKIVQSGPDSLTISWLPHPRPTSRVTHFTVYSKEIERGQDVNPQKWTAPNSGPSAGRLEIRNLRPRRAVFYFQVAAVSGQAGEGPRSSILSFTFNPTNKIVAAVVSIGSDYLVPRGSRLILPCTALGDTPLQISWFQDGRQLSDWLNLNPLKLGDQTQQPWIQQRPQDPDDNATVGLIQVLTNGSLSIGQLSHNGGGNYTCQARNRHGQDQVDYWLTVVTPPPAPQLRFAASNWSSVTLQWSVSSSSTDKNNRTRISTARNYVIKYRPRDAGWTEKILPATWRSVPIGDLNCGTEYEFILIASSRVGNSTSSNVVTAKTKGSPPEYLPTDAEDSDLTLTSTSCTVDLIRWQDRGCPIQQFIFRFRLTTDSISEWIIAGAESPPQQTFLLGGLIPGRDYAIRVTASNAAGSAQRDYSVRTPPLMDSHSKSDVYGDGLAPLFSDPRVAVPMAVSSLAIVLTIVTLLLRYRYRSGGEYIRPDSHPQTMGSSNIRTYADDTPEDGNTSTLSACQKRPPPMDSSGLSDYGPDQVSPYAVFPSLTSSACKSQFSSSRRMKTFVVDGTKDSLSVEMSNYAPPPPSMIRRMHQQQSDEEPMYDYIAPCATASGSNPSGRSNKLSSNPQSVFVPIIPARSTWNQQQQMYRQQHGANQSSPHYHGDWNNQETLALSQRL